MNRSTVGSLSILFLLVGSCSVRGEFYQETVISLQPTYYYQLNETDTTGGVIDSMGNAAPGTYNGDYVNGPPQVGVEGPGSVGSEENASNFYPLIPLPGLGENNLAHASNNAGHINLGPGTDFGASAITVSLFARGGGSAQGGDRLFTNNLTDPTQSFQINVGNNGIVVAVDPSETGELSERTVYLPDSSGHDRNIISPDNGWFHIVASTEGSSGAERAENIRVWINGVDRAPNLMPDATGWGTDTNLAKLGGRRENPADTTTHSGLQDELAIWLDRVLTDAEVAQLWSALVDPPIDADLDGSGEVDAADLEILGGNLGLHLDQQVVHDDGDLNFDGQIDLTDWVLFRDNFPSAAAAFGIPEPGSLTLAAFAMLGLLFAYRVSRTR